MSHRYPLAPAEELARGALLRRGLEPNDALLAQEMQVTRRQFLRWRNYPMGLKHADRIAVALGYHPYELWPEMVAHSIEAARLGEITKTCPECSRQYRCKNRAKLYCSKACKHRRDMREYYRRRYREDATFREAEVRRTRERNREIRHRQIDREVARLKRQEAP